jgi:hypothetical protein
LNIVASEQCGFGKGISTDNTAYKLWGSVVKFLNQKRHVGGKFCSLPTTVDFKLWNFTSTLNVNALSHIKTWLLSHALFTGRVFWHFHVWHHIPGSLGCCVSHIASRLLAAWSSMSGSEVTNTLTPSNPSFVEPYDCNKATTGWDMLCVFFHKLLPLQSWHWVGG